MTSLYGAYAAAGTSAGLRRSPLSLGTKRASRAEGEVYKLDQPRQPLASH